MNEQTNTDAPAAEDAAPVNVQLEEIHATPEGTNIMMSCTNVRILVEGIVELFDKAGAVNFCEMTMTHPERGEFVLTVQRKAGQTPAERAGLFESQSRYLAELVSAFQRQRYFVEWEGKHPNRVNIPAIGTDVAFHARWQNLMHATERLLSLCHSPDAKIRLITNAFTWVRDCLEQVAELMNTVPDVPPKDEPQTAAEVKPL